MHEFVSQYKFLKQRLGLKEFTRTFKNRYLISTYFVHINKTGGSSIERALGLPFQHKTAKEFRDEVGQRLWDDRFSFAFVRNPWDKVASHYQYRVKTNQTALATHPIGFKRWVEAAYGAQDSRYYDVPKMFMPQVDWVSDTDGSIIVNFIGFFERMLADFEIVCGILGREPGQLPHLKKSVKRDYREMYDSDSIEIVGRHFHRDIETFGYSFE